MSAQHRAVPSPAEAAAAAAAEIDRVYRSSYGAGAGNVSARFAGDHALVCFMEELEFPPSDQFMIDRGHGEEVVRIRWSFERAIEATFGAVVERATGRRVRSFSSTVNLDPPLAIGVFIFDDEAEEA